MRWLERIRRGAVSAVDGFAMLRDYGIDTAATRAAKDEAAVLAAAASIGYPVVLKTDEQAVHKTDVGGVVIGLDDDAELVAAYRQMASRLGPRVVVSRHVTAGVEVIVGGVRDPALGPLLLVGAGGLLVEVVADRAAALPPVAAPRARELLGRTVVQRLLLEPRGRKPADLDAVVQVVVGFGALLTELGDAIDAVEINPLICGPDGAVAVDVHLERRSPGRS
jgi:succinyl-CoA synthetase beta subunit